MRLDRAWDNFNVAYFLELHVLHIDGKRNKKKVFDPIIDQENRMAYFPPCPRSFTYSRVLPDEDRSIY